MTREQFLADPLRIWFNSDLDEGVVVEDLVQWFPEAWLNTDFRSEFLWRVKDALSSGGDIEDVRGRLELVSKLPYVERVLFFGDLRVTLGGNAELMDSLGAILCC